MANKVPQDNVDVFLPQAEPKQRQFYSTEKKGAHNSVKRSPEFTTKRYTAEVKAMRATLGSYNPLRMKDFRDRKN